MNKKGKTPQPRAGIGAFFRDRAAALTHSHWQVVAQSNSDLHFASFPHFSCAPLFLCVNDAHITVSDRLFLVL